LEFGPILSYRARSSSRRINYIQI